MAKKAPDTEPSLEIMRCECGHCGNHLLLLRNCEIHEIDGKLVPGLAVSEAALRNIYRGIGKALAYSALGVALIDELREIEKAKLLKDSKKTEKRKAEKPDAT